MQFVVGSAHRNNAAWVQHYFTRVAAFRDLLEPQGHTLRVIAVEGDSVDATTDALIFQSRCHRLDLELVRHHHGGPEFGSTEHHDRLVALSGVGNAILDSVKETDDCLLYVECDLIWSAPAAWALFTALFASNFDVVSPLVMAGDLFYDIFAFRANGDRFSPFAPFHYVLQPTAGLVEVDSVGSCLAMLGQTARDKRARMTDGVLIEWCNRLRGHGGRIGVLPTVRIRHPA